MKKKIALLLVLGIALFSFAFADRAYDFIAPTASDKDAITDFAETGLVVYDAGEDKFYGRTSDSAGDEWVDLSFSANDVNQIVYLKDVKSSNTDGGGITLNTWTPRFLNSIENSQTWITQGGGTTGTDGNADEFTLSAGKYKIQWTAPAFAVQGHQSRLRNTTDSTTDILGTSSYSNASGVDLTVSEGSGIINITSSKTFQIQHYSNATKTGNGLGDAVNTGENEIYTQVEITKIGE